jgi:hypothetical protein
MRCDQAGCAWPQSNDVNPDAVEDHGDLPGDGDFAFFTPIRLASFIPQASSPSYSPDGAWEAGERGAKR